MPKTFALAAVLALRQQKEDSEERSLGAIAAQMNQLRLALERLDHEVAALHAARANEGQVLHTGAEHHAIFARWKMVRDARTELRAQLETLERRRLEQQARYLVARRDRETLSELRLQQKTAWDAEIQAREQKRIEDLFTARHLRK